METVGVKLGIREKSAPLSPETITAPVRISELIP